MMLYKNQPLTSGDKAYTFTAKNLVFRKVSGFSTDNAPVPDTISVSSDITINTLYT